MSASAPTNFCCDRMRHDVEYVCPDTDELHEGDPRLCCDRFMDIRSDGSYGLIVHDGGGVTSVTIAFCPWCGKPLPDSRWWEVGGRVLDVFALEDSE